MSGRVSHSGPMMNNRNHSRLTYVKENAAPRIPSYRANSAAQSGYVTHKTPVDTIGSDQTFINQQRKDLRAFNRSDTMDNSKRQIKMPNDPSWVSDLRDSVSLLLQTRTCLFFFLTLWFKSLSLALCTYSMIQGITKCTCRVHCWLSQVKWIRCWKNTTGSSRNSPDRKQNKAETESCV